MPPVAKVPPERPLTREQLLRKVGSFRLLTTLFGRAMMGLGGKGHGRELFLDTRAGRARVLAYRLEDPEILPLFVNMHGGGFVIGHPEMDDRFLPRVADEANVKILGVDYSLAAEARFPVAINECYAVVKYAKEHAAELGIDPERIAIGGHSAGGNFSAAVCLLDAGRKELGLKALILDYPPLDIATDPYLKPRPKKALSPRMSACSTRPTPATERRRRTRSSPLATPRLTR
jgi:acetyl esterase